MPLLRAYCTLCNRGPGVRQDRMPWSGAEFTIYKIPAHRFATCQATTNKMARAGIPILLGFYHTDTTGDEQMPLVTVLWASACRRNGASQL